jgi:hypothetical protein
MLSLLITRYHQFRANQNMLVNFELRYTCHYTENMWVEAMMAKVKIYSIWGTPTKCPSTNVLAYKTSFLQNVLPQNILPQNVLPQNILPQNVPPTKRPWIQNVLAYKTSSPTKCPVMEGGTVEGWLWPHGAKPNLQHINFFYLCLVQHILFIFSMWSSIYVWFIIYLNNVILYHVNTFIFLLY